MKIISVVVAIMIIIGITNIVKTNQLNQKLKTENQQTQQLLVKLQEQQNEKNTRELTDLLQDIAFIMEVDSNCPPDEMINQMKELYSNEKDLNPAIRATYKEVLNQFNAQNCN